MHKNKRNVFFLFSTKKLDQLHACKKYNHSVRHIDAVNKTQRDGGRWGQMEMGIYRGSRGRDGGRLGTWRAEMRKKMGVDKLGVDGDLG